MFLSDFKEFEYMTLQDKKIRGISNFNIKENLNLI